MRVLHLADRLGGRGGAHRHLVGVLQGLRERGHEVAVAAGVAEPAPVDGFRPTWVVPALASRTRAEPDLDGILAAFRPDAVHLHTVVNPAVLEWAGDVAAGVAAVLTVQDHRYFCPGRGKWTLDGRACREPMTPEACRTCFDDEAYFGDVLALTEERLRALRRLRLVVLSRYMRDELRALGVPGERVSVIPPFVEGLDPSALPDGPPCVAFVGRLVAAKGVLEAVRAWRLSGVALPLVAAGSGPLREEARRRGALTPGWLDRAALSRLLRRSRALLLPSLWQEPFGIAGLEALSLGVPVVAFDSGGIRDWHPGPLVPLGDVPALARSLAAAVSGPRPTPPAGFERAALLERLEGCYGAAARRARGAGLEATA